MVRASPSSAKAGRLRRHALKRPVAGALALGDAGEEMVVDQAGDPWHPRHAGRAGGWHAPGCLWRIARADCPGDPTSPAMAWRFPAETLGWPTGMEVECRAARSRIPEARQCPLRSFPSPSFAPAASTPQRPARPKPWRQLASISKPSPRRAAPWRQASRRCGDRRCGCRPRGPSRRAPAKARPRAELHAKRSQPSPSRRRRRDAVPGAVRQPPRIDRRIIGAARRLSGTPRPRDQAARRQ